jgi:CRP/FNR family cyclic AMP-dependent transcriptional regulator
MVGDLEVAMDDQQKADALSRVSFFEKISGDERAKLAGHTEHVHVRSGSVIYSRDSAPDELVILVDGSVELVAPGDEGRERVVDTRNAPGAFGEMALLDRGPRMVTARATKDSDLLTLDRERFLKLLHANPDVREAVYDFMSTINRTLVRQDADKGIEILRTIASAMRTASQ